MSDAEPSRKGGLTVKVQNSEALKLWCSVSCAVTTTEIREWQRSV